MTAGATDAYTTKSFARTLEKETKDGVEEVVIGPGSKAFRKLFGEIQDARYSIYEGTAKLSAILRKNQLFDDILDADELAKANVTPDTPP